MARENGQWKVVEVKNVKQLLDKLKRQEEKRFNNPPATLPPEAAPLPPDVPPPDAGATTDTP